MSIRNLAELDLLAAAAFPTSEGGTLRFDPELGDVTYHFALDVCERDLDGMMPKDILRFTVWIADANGAVWEGHSVFTAEKIVPLFLDAGYSTPAPTFESGAPHDHLIAFDAGLGVVDARVFWDDDDGGRHSLTIGGITFPLSLKHAGLSFDVAAILQEDESNRLAVRLNRGLVTREGALVPPLYTFVPLDHVWGWNGAAYDADEEYWYDSSLAVPLVFQRTTERGRAQASVVASRRP